MALSVGIIYLRQTDSQTQTKPNLNIRTRAPCAFPNYSELTFEIINLLKHSFNEKYEQLKT